MTTHLDSDILAAYGERRLGPADRAMAEAHLADCSDCRRDLAAVADQLRPVRRRRQLLRAVPLLAAASVLVVVLNQNPAATAPDTLRPGGEEGLPVIEAIAPAEQAEVTRAGLRFVWSSDGPDALYDLRLTDLSGLLLWQASTADTILSPPDSLTLTPGAQYLWWVDVLLPDGRLAKTALREFTLGPAP